MSKRNIDVDAARKLVDEISQNLASLPAAAPARPSCGPKSRHCARCSSARTRSTPRSRTA